MALDTPSEVNISSWELMKLQVLTKEVQSSRQLKLTAIFVYSSGEQLAREEAIRQKWKHFQQAESSSEDQWAGDTWKSRQEADSKSLFSGGQAQPEMLNLEQCTKSG